MLILIFGNSLVKTRYFHQSNDFSIIIKCGNQNFYSQIRWQYTLNHIIRFLIFSHLKLTCSWLNFFLFLPVRIILKFNFITSYHQLSASQQSSLSKPPDVFRSSLLHYWSLFNSFCKLFCFLDFSYFGQLQLKQFTNHLKQMHELRSNLPQNAGPETHPEKLQKFKFFIKQFKVPLNSCLASQQSSVRKIDKQMCYHSNNVSYCLRATRKINKKRMSLILMRLLQIFLNNFLKQCQGKWKTRIGDTGKSPTSRGSSQLQWLWKKKRKQLMQQDASALILQQHEQQFKITKKKGEYIRRGQTDWKDDKKKRNKKNWRNSCPMRSLSKAVQIQFQPLQFLMLKLFTKPQYLYAFSGSLLPSSDQFPLFYLFYFHFLIRLLPTIIPANIVQI